MTEENLSKLGIDSESFVQRNAHWRIKNRSNSKDLIELIREKNKYYVKKTWIDIKRGEDAIRKQIEFDEIRISDLIIKTPKIYDTTKLKNNYIAKMEYIEGISGAEIISIGSRKTSLKIKDGLSLLLNINFENSKITKLKTELLVKKLDEIISNSQSDYEIISILNDLKAFIMRQKFLDIPIGPCHGDLTLSNIIVSSSGSINLIDFLPSFIETPLWDVVKIYQDLVYGWSYRDLRGPERASAKLFFLNCLPNQITLYEKVMKKELLIFDALNLSRLSPYIKNKNTRDWLLFNLKKSLKNLN